jgi:hypothetical protein
MMDLLKPIPDDHPMYAVQKANEENRLFRYRYFLNEAKRLNERAEYYKKEADRFLKLANQINPTSQS